MASTRYALKRRKSRLCPEWPSFRLSPALSPERELSCGARCSLLSARKYSQPPAMCALLMLLIHFTHAPSLAYPYTHAQHAQQIHRFTVDDSARPPSVYTSYCNRRVFKQQQQQESSRRNKLSFMSTSAHTAPRPGEEQGALPEGFEALLRCSEGGYSRPTPMCRCASL